MFLSSLTFANYPDLYSNLTVNPGDVINITGGIKNSTGGLVGNENFTINFTTFNGTASTNGTGSLHANFSAPTKLGEHNITITYNGTSRKIKVWITNVSSTYSTISFITQKPPFSAGDTFLINVTMKNYTNAHVTNFTPLLEVYTTNGQKQSWTISNTTNSAVHNGIITYNVTVPSSAEGGTYAMILEKGRVVTSIYILSGYVMAVNIQTLQNETRASYAPGSQLDAVAKIRDTSGNPISNATNVIATIGFPNGTSINFTFSSGSSGRYNATFISNTLSGDYTVSVNANSSGTILDGSTSFTLRAISVSLSEEKGFFHEWGDSTGISPGSILSFNAVVTNLTDDSVYTGSTNGGDSQVNCSSVSLLDVTNSVNGSKIPTAITSTATGLFSGTTVCKIVFAAPNTTGTYRIRVNASIGTGSSLQSTGITYFSVQNYFMKPTTVSSLGGDFDFVVMVLAGSNLTFQLGAFDLANNREVAGNNITNISIIKIKPLSFAGGGDDITEGLLGMSTKFNISNITSGSATAGPTITITLPVNRTGPFIAEITAIINGTTPETITGRAFFMSKYVMGFLSNSGRDDVAGGKGEFEGGGFGGFGSGSSCSGREVFTGDVKDLNGNNNAQGVEFVNILEAREELTGSNIASCLSMGRNVTDTNGKINLSVTFSSSGSCASLSGFHIVIFNVTYQGKTDEVPAGFNCKRLNFFPSTSQFNYAPTSSVNFTINNARRINDSRSISNGTILIQRGFNFNPSTGPKALTPNGTLNFTMRDGTANYILYPSNFSLSKWPSGFIDTTPRLCSNSSEGSTCDTSFGGFAVKPYNVRVETINGQSPFGGTFSSGQNVTIRIQASTNVSRINYSSLVNGNTTTTGFTLKFGLPFGGKLTSLTTNAVALISDGWNHSSHTQTYGAELWEINATVPSTAKKGFNMLIITINNSLSEESEADPPIFMSIKTFNVQVGVEEGVMMTRFFNLNMQTQNESLSDEFGFNATNLTGTRNLRSKSGVVCARLGFNSTIYNENSAAGVHGNDYSVLLLDNTTAGVYDTVILNRSGEFTILRQGQNRSAMYIWKIDDCGFFKVVNATKTRQNSFDSYAGSYERGSIFTVPYIVKSGATSSPLSGVTVSANALIKQLDSSGGGAGNGFGGKLASSAYTATSGTTDGNGLAFLQMNISGDSGSMMIFWKLNTSDGLTDTASFNSFGFGGESGTQVQIRNFDAFGGRVARLGNNSNRVITVSRTNISSSLNVWNYTLLNPDVFAYNGTGRLPISNSETNLWFVFNSTNNLTIIDDDTNLNTTGFASNADGPSIAEGGSISEVSGFSNSTYMLSSDSYALSAIRTVGNDIKLAFYSDTSAYQYPVTAANSNVSVRICAQDFARPAAGYSGVSVYMYAQDFSTFPATQIPLNWSDPINGTVYTFGNNNVTTGPKGCVAVDVVHSTGWSTRPAAVKATLTRNTGTQNQTEDIWVDWVFRYNG